MLIEMRVSFSSVSYLTSLSVSERLVSHLSAPCRHEAQQPAAAGDRLEVRRRQLRHRLRRLPHVHRAPGEHVQYVHDSEPVTALKSGNETDAANQHL